MAGTGGRAQTTEPLVSGSQSEFGARRRHGTAGGVSAADFKGMLAQVATGACLTQAQAEAAFDVMMSGEATPAQIGAFLMGLRVRGR